MTNLPDPSMHEFFDTSIGANGLGLSLQISPKRRTTALVAPLISYFYSTGYFAFGHTEPEGVVIPLEIIGSGSPFRDSTCALVDPSPEQIAIGDNVHVEWTPQDGTPAFQSPPYSVQSKDQYIPIAIPDRDLERFAGRTVLVTFFHLPQSGGATPSPSRLVYVARELGNKPVLEVEGVVDGVMKASAFPDGLKVGVRPIKNMLACYGVEVLWAQAPDYWVERQRHLAVNPQQAMNFHIAPSVYQPHAGRRVTVKYFIYLGARLSPNFFWSTGAATEVSFEVR